jgi:hypothetical protein
VHSIERVPEPAPPRGTIQLKCPACQRFTRLLPGDTECAACAGQLPLEFPREGGER